MSVFGEGDHEITGEGSRRDRAAAGAAFPVFCFGAAA